MGGDFIIVQLFVGAGSALINLPLAGAATAGLKFSDIPDGTALFTTARNVGGSLGLASCAAFLDRRAVFHTAQMEQVTTANSLTGQDRVNQIAGAMMQGATDAAHARFQALRAVAAEVHRQALVMSYIDAFTIMGWVMLFLTPIAVFLK